MKKVFEIGEGIPGIFKKRLNKYVAEVEINGNIEQVHVHDPGRLTELLFENNIVEVKYAASETRKTSWDLIGAQKNGEIILVNSMYHNKIAKNILDNKDISPLAEVCNLKSEVKYGDSRFDFKGTRGETDIWIEIKGCTLSEDSVAMFPDAPTVRGARHLKELIELKKNGAQSAVLILLFSPAEKFRPKHETDPKFADVFYAAVNSGVAIYPIRLKYERGAIWYLGTAEIITR